MRALDGSTNLSVLGANAVLAVSLAISRAAANTQQMPLHRYIASSFPGRTPSLPMPMVNILSGGAHAGRGMDLQDFLLVPIGANSYQEAMAMIMAERKAD
jgi:enolase